MPQTHKQKIGKIGEDIACMFLKKRGFSIVERNYWQKYGELDIVVKKGKALRFVEVKTVSRENIKNTLVENDNYRPEENIHKWKLQRLSKTIQTYFFEKNIPESSCWQFDVIVVFLNTKEKTARVRFLEDVVI